MQRFNTMFDMKEDQGHRGLKHDPCSKTKMFNLGFLYFQFLVRCYGQNNTIYILYVWDPIKACVQNGISGSYMDAVFVLVVREELEIWTSLPHSLIKEGLLQLPG